MDIGEKLTVLENLICNFATTQFELNEVPPTQARLVMGCVYNRFQEHCLNSVLMGRVTIQQAGGAAGEQEHTGTVEDLKRDFEKTGFHPNGGKEDNA